MQQTGEGASFPPHQSLTSRYAGRAGTARAQREAWWQLRVLLRRHAAACLAGYIG